MPVDKRHHQPAGILHGGVSVLLAETLGSLAISNNFYCVGLEINANHLSKVESGFVTGIAKSLHLGISTHVWEIKIYNESDKLACVSRLTLAVIQKTENNDLAVL